MDFRESKTALGLRSLISMAMGVAAVGVIGMTGAPPAQADADDYNGPVVVQPQGRSEYREERREERPGAGVELNFGHHKAGVGVGGGTEYREQREYDEDDE